MDGEVGGLQLAKGNWQRAIGKRQLAKGKRQLAKGNWQKAIGKRQLAKLLVKN
jgi:hypothetical protein